uniref:IST1 homolog n=1 Tax=Hyaloperonospora arabidopsidis (strain Emoy2) TaxID=559515 RepID=M4B5L5_HYAAE
MFGFNVNKLKPNLTMAVHRIGIVKNKKAHAALAQRREVARLLREGKEEKARIRNLIKSEFNCPYDMREAVCTLMWAASRTEVPELAEVKRQLTKKYGQDFEAAASRNVDGCVNERVMQKLSVQPPSAFLVVNYMKEIAREFHVDWNSDEAQAVEPLAPSPVPTGSTVMSANVSGSDFAHLHALVRSCVRRLERRVLVEL